MDNELAKTTIQEKLLAGSLFLAHTIAFMLRYGKSQSKALRHFHFELYKDSKKEWRWRLKATNNKVVATSGEGYKNKEDCVHAIKLLKLHSPVAPIENKLN